MLTDGVVFCFLLSASLAAPTLEQLHIIFRHGDRSPTGTYPNDPYLTYPWPGGWGQLTNIGRMQMYQLGQNLRKQYSDFIPAKHSLQNVSVSSSYSVRCRMSALLVCAGMFPPKDDQIWNEDLPWIPIPVDYLPKSQDNVLAMKSDCPRYWAELNAGRHNEAMKELERKYHGLMEHLRKHTGGNITNIEHVEDLFNALEIEKNNNLTLPSWINDTMMAEMKKLAARNLAFYSETEYMKRIRGGSFLKVVLTSMEKTLSGEEEEPLLHLYGAHDITLVHILRSLNLVDTIKPGFGAYMTFELYSDGEVKISYIDTWDGKPDPDLVVCRTPCKLAELKTRLEPMLPVDFEKECQLSAGQSTPAGAGIAGLYTATLALMTIPLFFW